MTGKLVEAIENLASCVAILAVEIDGIGVMSENTALDFNKKFARYERAIAEWQKATEKGDA